MSAAAAAGDSTMGRIVLDASLTRANPQPIAYETRGGVPTGKLEFNAFKGKSPLNGFVLAVHEAYSNHRALRLTPDDIWTVITQGVGQHIYRNAERLRGKFVAHAGKKLVQVVRNDFVRGRTTREDWMGVVAELTDKVRTLDNGESKVMSHLVQQFGTTQPLHTFLATRQRRFKRHRLDLLSLSPYLGSKNVTRDDHLMSHLKEGPSATPHMASDCFPTGLRDVPFVWSYYGHDLPMTIYSGFDNSTLIDGTMHCVHGFAVQYSTHTSDT
jgi:hypothetical protein